MSQTLEINPVLNEVASKKATAETAERVKQIRPLGSPALKRRGAFSLKNELRQERPPSVLKRRKAQIFTHKNLLRQARLKRRGAFSLKNELHQVIKPSPLKRHNALSVQPEIHRMSRINEGNKEQGGGRRSHRRKRSSHRKSHHKRKSHRKSHHKRKSHRR